MKIEVALLSVSDRTGIVELARQLVEMQVRLLSTGGTAQVLQEGGIPVTPVSEYTGFPEILEGRVKTLHPRIHAGILARQDLPRHRKVLLQHQISAIGLVVVNLYPFAQTVAREGVTLQEAVEQIDIGGPTLIRAAAKNFQHVTVLVDPSDYSEVVAEMRGGGIQTRESTRWRLARRAFQHTSVYDAAISSYLEGIGEQEQVLPEVMVLRLEAAQTLRYGENPHQRAGLYRLQSSSDGLVMARQKQGKQLSFNNYLDLHAAWSLCGEFQSPFCAIVKHTNPCGAAEGIGLSDAYEKALACDPVSAFGSVIGFNREVDGAAAKLVSGLFVEAVIAPSYEVEAVEIFSRKKNLRVMEIGTAAGKRKESPQNEFDFKKISGGFLVQEWDRHSIRQAELKVATRRPPSEEEIKDLLFAWSVCKHVKSNAIVLARHRQVVGIGAGQMSRVDSVRLAAQKAQLSLAGCVMASDAFFPFRDGLDEAARIGVKAVIQPGGSVRDKEVVAAADEHDVAMVFTGVRHFKH